MATLVCPARAGMIRMLPHSMAISICLPRTRGDDPASYTATVATLGFAPHARG